MPQENSTFERWRTPRWFPWVGVPLLAALILVNVGMFYVWVHDRRSGRDSLPLLLVINSGIALILLVRLRAAKALRAHSSRGPDLSDSGEPSNNRWRGP
jgi:hypothetical protein